MEPKELTKLSKFLSLVLRHKPETVGITLDEQGWTDVETLLKQANLHGHKIDFELLKLIVSENNKQRFIFNEDYSQIRANQGHSVTVDLGYTAQIPPKILYHGTGEKSVASILANGITKQNRHHVHLSSSIETAHSVGTRHGKPAIFEVMAETMHAQNFEFYLSDNGVWLTEFVPAEYLKLKDK